LGHDDVDGHGLLLFAVLDSMTRIRSTASVTGDS
jgi:hypothetical protein